MINYKIVSASSVNNQRERRLQRLKELVQRYPSALRYQNKQTEIFSIRDAVNGVWLPFQLDESGNAEAYSNPLHCVRDLRKHLQDLQEKGEHVRRLLQQLKSSKAPPVVAAYRLFGLKIGADEATVNRRYRQLALRAHPDKIKTLNQTRMTELNNARDLILDYLGKSVAMR